MSEHVKTWTDASGASKTLRIWLDEDGSEGMPGRGDGLPRLCWELKIEGPDRTEALSEIAKAIGLKTAVANRVAAIETPASGGQGGSYPAETDEQIATAIHDIHQNVGI